MTLENDALRILGRLEGKFESWEKAQLASIHERDKLFSEQARRIAEVGSDVKSLSKTTDRLAVRLGIVEEPLKAALRRRESRERVASDVKAKLFSKTSAWLVALAGFVWLQAKPIVEFVSTNIVNNVLAYLKGLLQ